MLVLFIKGLSGLPMLKKIVKKVIRHKTPLDAYRFHIDKVDSDIIHGWAHKQGEGNHTVNIEIRNNNEVLFTVKANEERADLKAAAIGTGQYGFSIKTSHINPQSDINSIDVFIDGLKANAKPIPLTLTGSNNKTQQAATPAAVLNTHQMHIDSAKIDKVIGWAKKKDSVTHRSLVELKLGDVVLGSDTADTFRQSIKTAGIGDGSYCFEITPAIHLFPSTSVSCDLYLDGKKSHVAPIVLTVTEQELEAAKFTYEFSNEITTLGTSVTQELQRLTDDVTSQNGNALNVALENIATLNTRVEIIEQILTKHFANKSL